jgi:hypothetical protein
MTATTSKLGADMLTDEQLIEIASRYAHSDGWLNGDGALNFARALLARQPAAIDKPSYREVGVWEPDGSKFKTYAKENLNGKAMFLLEASKPAPSVEQDERGALTEVGFITHDDLHGWQFAPTVAWTWLGRGRALYARAASTSANVASSAGDPQ